MKDGMDGYKRHERMAETNSKAGLSSICMYTDTDTDTDTDINTKYQYHSLGIITTI